MNKGTAYTITFDAFDTSTGALKSGLTNLTVTLSKNGAAYVSASGAVSEIGSTGTYKITLTASETNYDNVTLLAASGTSGVVAPPVHLTFLPAPLTVAQIQSGLATSSLVTSLQTHGDSAWATATGFPTASDVTTSVWSNASRTLTASPTDLTTLQTTANSIKAKTDLIPASPAAVGSAMTLTSAYDSAKTAAPTTSAISTAVWGYTLSDTSGYPLFMLHNETELPYTLESAGTLRMLEMLPVLYMLKEDAEHVFVMDELDRGLHFLLTKWFIQKFMENNKTNANQLIFTTHDTNLLSSDLFRRDEVWFAEKDQEGATSLSRLSDFRVGEGLNFEKGYLSGRFGGIPLFEQMDSI